MSRGSLVAVVAFVVVLLGTGGLALWVLGDAEPPPAEPPPRGTPEGPRAPRPRRADPGGDPQPGPAPEAGSPGPAAVAPPLPVDAEPLPEREPVPGEGLAFPFPGYASLSSADWRQIGEACHEQALAHRDLAFGLLRNRETRGAIRRADAWGARLMSLSNAVAPELMGTRMDPQPGDLFLHPAFAANALAAALEHAGLPLDDAQREAVRAAAAQPADEALAAAARPHTPLDRMQPPLPRALAESEAKAAFLARLLGPLREDQLEAVRPRLVRDRVGFDHLSPAVLWIGRCEVMPAADLEELRRHVTARIVGDLAVPPEREPAILAALRESDRVGFEDEQDVLARHGYPTLAAAEAAARRALELAEELADVAGVPERERRGIPHRVQLGFLGVRRLSE